LAYTFEKLVPQHKFIEYHTGSCVCTTHVDAPQLTTTIPPPILFPIYKIQSFIISNNSLYFVGQRVFKKVELPSIFALTLRQIQQETLIPATHHCYTTNITVTLPLTLIHSAVNLSSLPQYLRHPTPDTFVWTDHFDGSQLQHHLYSRKTGEMQTTLLDQLTKCVPPIQNSITTTTTYWSHLLAHNIHNELSATHNHRTRTIKCPFPLDAYLMLFGGVGDHFPLQKVDKDMKFTTHIYANDFPIMDERMPNGWREKVFKRDNTRTDDFLRIVSVWKPRQQTPALPPPGTAPIPPLTPATMHTPAPNKKKRKQRNVKGDILFVATYDVGTQAIQLSFSFHKYPATAHADPTVLEIW